MNKTLFGGAFSAKNRMFFGILLAMVWIIVGCSDAGKGSDEISIREQRANSVGNTNDGNDVFVFQKDELNEVLFKIDTTAASDTGFAGKLLFKDLDEEKIPQVGDIIASGQTTIAEYGFLYKVIGVYTENGVTNVEVRSASLEEAVKDVDFESETEFQFDEDGNLLGVLQKSSPSQLRLTTPAIPIKIQGVKVAEIKASIAYTISLNFNISIKDWNIQTVKMTLVQNGDVTLKGTVGNVKGEIKPRPQLVPPISLPSIEFLVGFVPVVITNEILLELKVKAEAQVGIEATYTISGRGEYGFEYRNGEFYRINDNNFSKTFNLEHQLSGTARVGVILGLRSRLYGAVGLILGAGLALDLYVGGNPVGTHVFDNGFRGDYTDYRSIWAGTGITDLETGGATINIAINNSGGAATSNFFRTIANEARLDLGLNFEAAITLDILKFKFRYTFAETFIKLGTLYRASFLPLFDDPQVTVAGANIEVRSRIERDFLNYPVMSYGICVEIPLSNECRNGRGIRWVDNALVRAGSMRNFTATFNNLEPGKTYAIRPYFSTGLGTYYDKATSFTPYTLTINQNPATGGTVTYNPKQESYNHGTQVTVVATASPGYEFVGWSGALTSTNAAERIIINSNLALTANFQQRIYTLTTIEAPVVGSRIIRTPNKTSYEAGEKVTVSVEGTPSNYQFIGWAGASTSENTTTSVTMDGDKTLIAMFSSRSATDGYTLTTLVPNGGGTVTLSSRQVNYSPGTSVTATASPNTYYRFKGWSGTLTSTSNPIAVAMSRNHVLAADFVRTYDLTVNSNPTAGGTVTGNGTFDTGTEVPIIATAAASPSPGYRFSHWSGDGVANQYSPNTTVSMTADKAVTANFVQMFTLTINRNNTAGGTVTGAGTFDANTPVNITASPASNYGFVNWTVTSGSAQFGNANSATTTVILSSNATIRANFARISVSDLIFDSSESNYTINKDFIEAIEIYAIGGGGGGQGGNEHTWSSSDGTGGAGGGGAANFAKFDVKGPGPIIFSNITIGQGGAGGDHYKVDIGSWQSGYSGSNGIPTSVTWSGGSLTAAGGKGGGMYRSDDNRQDQTGGDGGVSSWSGSGGESGSQKSCVESKGGKAGTIPANTGSLTTAFGGGSGGMITDCSSTSSWFVENLTQYYRNPGIGGGGAGGWRIFKGRDGGKGQVRIRVLYREAL